MARNLINFAIDFVTALVMAAMLGTGLIIRFALPPGSGSRRILWGYGRHDWGDVHFWLAIAALAIVFLHVALHWQWVCAMFLRLLPGKTKITAGAVRRNTLGVAVLLALTALFIAFVKVAERSVRESASSIAEAEGRGPVREGERSTQQRGRMDEADTSIRGSMTLAEAAQACGLTVEAARERLRLPTDVPADERLGRLSKKYQFSMQDVREKLESKVATTN